MRVMGQKIPKLPLVRADVRPTLFFSLEWVLIKRNSKGAQTRSRNNEGGAKRELVLTRKQLKKHVKNSGLFEGGRRSQID